MCVTTSPSLPTTSPSLPLAPPLPSHQLVRLITELEEAGGEGGRGAHSKLKERLTHFNTTAAAMVKVGLQRSCVCVFAWFVIVFH